MHPIPGPLVDQTLMLACVPGAFVHRLGDATSVLDACDREQRMSAGKRPTLLIYRVICTDQDAMNWPEEDIGNLRVALNALVRLFRL